MLDSFYLKYRVNQVLTETGIDSLEKCRNEKFFKNYPHPVEYKFNSRGFRDKEWPDDLSDCVICFGDSFTVGLGSPYDHIWPVVLEQKTGRRTINISMDGASNDWISRKCKEFIQEVKPRAIVVVWSFTNRREDTDCSKDDEDRRIWYYKDSTEQKDAEHFFNCRQRLLMSIDKIPYVDFLIPNHQRFNRLLKLDKRFLGSIQQLDYSRDSYHFDLLTSANIVNKIKTALDL